MLEAGRTTTLTAADRQRLRGEIEKTRRAREYNEARLEELQHTHARRDEVAARKAEVITRRSAEVQQQLEETQAKETKANLELARVSDEAAALRAQVAALAKDVGIDPEALMSMPSFYDPPPPIRTVPLTLNITASTSALSTRRSHATNRYAPHTTRLRLGAHCCVLFLQEYACQRKQHNAQSTVRAQAGTTQHNPR